MEFLFDITSSITMLPPMDTALFTVDANGPLSSRLGLRAPRVVMFAMGRYCSAKPTISRTYPVVSALALEAWDAGKEKMALDNFFVSMGGNQWSVKNGWSDDTADLNMRYGITTDAGGHVIAIHLAANNLQGTL